MQYSTSIEQAVLTLRLTGRLTFNDHALARAMVGEIVAAGAAQVVIDVSALTFIDSPGVGMLLIAQEELRRVGARATLVGAQGMVQRVFRAVHIDKVFDGGVELREMPKRSVVAGATPG